VKVLATTQHWRPSPEPCGVPRLAITRLDAPCPDLAAILVVVIAAVGEQHLRALAGAANLPSDWLHTILGVAVVDGYTRDTLAEYRRRINPERPLPRWTRQGP
jgi:hypothetical protein